MATNSVLLNARHPMRHLPRDNKIYLAEDGHTEILGPGYEDPRHWWVTFLDPFNLWGMWKGKSLFLGQKFWETHAEARVLANEPTFENLSSKNQGRAGARFGENGNK